MARSVRNRGGNNPPFSSRGGRRGFSIGGSSDRGGFPSGLGYVRSPFSNTLQPRMRGQMNARMSGGNFPGRMSVAPFRSIAQVPRGAHPQQPHYGQIYRQQRPLQNYAPRQLHSRPLQNISAPTGALRHGRPAGVTVMPSKSIAAHPEALEMKSLPTTSAAVSVIDVSEGLPAPAASIRKTVSPVRAPGRPVPVIFSSGSLHADIVNAMSVTTSESASQSRDAVASVLNPPALSASAFAPSDFVTPIKRKHENLLNVPDETNAWLSAPSETSEVVVNSVAKVKRTRSVFSSFQKTLSVKRLNKALQESFRLAKSSSAVASSAPVENLPKSLADTVDMPGVRLARAVHTEVQLKHQKDNYHDVADDESQFVQRLESFAPVELWWCKPDELSPVECARRGWRLVGMDLIECITCAARLHADLMTYYETATGSASRRAVEQVFIRRMRGDGHQPLCQWRVFVCPLYMSNVFVHNNTWKTMAQLFKQNMECWLKVVADDMPVCHVPERLLREFNGNFDALFSAVKRIALHNFPTLPFSGSMPTTKNVLQTSTSGIDLTQQDWRLFSAALLSIFGYHSEENELGWSMFQCRSCLRRDFSFSCKTVERMLKNTLLARDSFDGLMPSDVYKAICEENVGDNFLLFQLVGNHRSFCPWRQDQLAYATFLPQRLLNNVTTPTKSASKKPAHVVSTPLPEIVAENSVPTALSSNVPARTLSLSSDTDNDDRDDILLPGFMLCFKLLYEDAETSATWTHSAIESARNLLELAKAAKRGVAKMVDDLPFQHRGGQQLRKKSVDVDANTSFIGASGRK